MSKARAFCAARRGRCAVEAGCCAAPISIMLRRIARCNNTTAIAPTTKVSTPATSKSRTMAPSCAMSMLPAPAASYGQARLCVMEISRWDHAGEDAEAGAPGAV
jgi:hypothetical protein